VKRAGLASEFFGWLYGVPFLIIVGLLRRTSSPYLSTHAQAVAFGATTDRLLLAGLVLNLALPIVGIVVARIARDEYWTWHFGAPLLGAVLMYVLVSIAGSAASAPLIGTVPTDHEPAPRVTQCIPVSGGHGCREADKRTVTRDISPGIAWTYGAEM
jgi:hypothetical protein